MRGLQQSVFRVYRICDQGPGPLPNLDGFLAMVLHGSHFELLILLGGDCTSRSLQSCWILQHCVGRIWRWDSSSSLMCILHLYLADQQLFGIASLTHLVERRELEEQKTKNKSRIRRIDEGKIATEYMTSEVDWSDIRNRRRRARNSMITLLIKREMKKTEEGIEREQQQQQERNRLEVNDLFLSVLLQNATWLLRATDTLTAWLILAGEKTMQHHNPAPFLLSHPTAAHVLAATMHIPCMHARTHANRPRPISRPCSQRDKRKPETLKKRYYKQRAHPKP